MTRSGIRWKVVGVVGEGDPVRIRDVNVWDYTWTRLKEVELPHPSYPSQLHSMNVYEIKAGGEDIRFAAGELQQMCGASTFPNDPCLARRWRNIAITLIVPGPGADRHYLSEIFQTFDCTSNEGVARTASLMD